MADAGGKKASGFSTLGMVIIIGLALIILLDEQLRNFLTRMVGYVFDPLFGFNGEHPVWTIFIVGLVMIAASTLVRHFFVDWMSMARIQEEMKAYQKEFKEARDSNNTFKMKRLTEYQPEIMRKQAELSSGQMKPMFLTMIVVIPLFAWVAAFVGTPVQYDVEAPQGADAILVPMETHVALGATLASSGIGMGVGADVFALPLTDTQGALQLVRSNSGREADAIPLQGGVLNLTAHRVASLPGPGLYRLTREGALETGTASIEQFIVYAQGATTRQAILVNVARDVQVTEPVDLHVFVPVKGQGIFASRGLALNVTGQAGETVTVAPLGAEHAVNVYEHGSAYVVPHMATVPWDEKWDMTMPVQWDFFPFNIIPRWIALYSLFSIPFGQVLQKALKLNDYRKKAKTTPGPA